MSNRLSEIQRKLVAPKNQRNNFGNYNYRSCEDILEAVKPLLSSGECVLLNDEIVAIGNRIYVKATATWKEKDATISVSAFAREAETKKGMDEAQITGSASSYARKYALNGLLLCDDNRDSDVTNTHGKEDEKNQKTDLTQKYIDQINFSESISELQSLSIEIKTKEKNISSISKVRSCYAEKLKQLTPKE